MKLLPNTSLFSFPIQSLLLCAAIALSTPVLANDPQQSVNDCLNSEYKDIDDPLLTHEEKMKLMQEQLHKSLNAHSACIKTAVSSMANESFSGGGGGGGNGQQGGQNGQGGNGGDGQQQGDNKQGGSAAEGNSDQAVENPVAGSPSDTTKPQKNEPMPGSPGPSHGGQKRKVIKPKNDANAICKILYEQIQQEADPEVKQGLTAQYEQYQCSGR